MFANKFSAFAVAAAALFTRRVLAAPAGAEDETLDKRISLPGSLLYTLLYCDNADLGGNCASTPFNISLSTCYDLPAAFNDDISSAQIHGVLGELPNLLNLVSCTLYADAGCGGDLYTFTDTVDDLETVGFNDVTSSYQCGALGGGL